MIRTYTPADLATLTLPALPGLLDGWTGPIEVFEHRCEPGHPNADVIIAHGERWPGYWRPALWPVNNANFSERLPLCRPEARYRMACWLAERDAALWWALSPGPSTLPAWQSAAILHASALRVSKGMGPVHELWAKGEEYEADPPHREPVYRWNRTHPAHRGLLVFGTWQSMLFPGSTRGLLDSNVLRIEVPDE